MNRNYRAKIKADPELREKSREYHKIHNKNYIQTSKCKLRRLELKNKRIVDDTPYNNNFKVNFPQLYNMRQRDGVKKYRKNNPDKVAECKIRRRNSELQSIPKWLTEDDLFKIKLIYLKRDFISEITGIPHHVDHIHPLVSKYCCGLHVPCNLQVITATENMKKSNKLIK